MCCSYKSLEKKGLSPSFFFFKESILSILLFSTVVLLSNQLDQFTFCVIILKIVHLQQECSVTPSICNYVNGLLGTC